MGAMSFAILEGRNLIWGFHLDNYIELATRPYLWRAVIASIEITLTVTLISVVLAYPLAATIAFRVPRHLQRLVLLLAILPFWTSYVVRSYAWLLVLAREGVLNQTLINLGLIAEPITLANTRFATVTGFVHFFVMLLTLTIYANLVQLSPNYRRAAMDLGANAFQTFRHVILPLTLPGIVTGAFLTFVLCIGDYVTPHVLGGNNELTMPQVIMVQLGRRADFPLASALAIVMMGMVTLAYLAAARWLRLDRV
jgi:spermidine/putrescine transport system permease protein